MQSIGTPSLRKGLRTIAAIGCLALLLVSGCGKRTMVVLLPDPNGKVGKVAVTNPEGDQLLNEAYQSTVVTRPGVPPKDPAIMEKGAVEKKFRRALEITPDIPVTYTLFFEMQTTELKAYSKALIPEIVKDIGVRKSTDVSVVGHSDRMGAAAADRALAFARARKVADMLIALGVDALIVEIGYHGGGNPLIATPEGIREPKNRRVDVTVR